MIAASLLVVSLLLGPAAWAARPRPAPGLFKAAAGKADITPNLKRGRVWLAGYGASGRRAQGVHDRLYARAILVSDGTRLAALVALDSIGLFREDVLSIRRRLGYDGAGKRLLLAATHDHSAPDTLGLWGRVPGVSGADLGYRRRVKNAVVRLVRDLEGRLADAELSAGSARLDPAGLCRDRRDPVVMDPEVHAVQLRPRGTRVAAQAIGTLVRWSCHAEVLDRDNRLVTADFPGALCDAVERSEGGTCAFFPGLIGGLMTPDVDRSKGLEGQFAEARRVGEGVARAALAALRSSPARAAKGVVSGDSRLVRLRVENSRYLLFLRSLAFGHALLDGQGRRLSWWRTAWLPVRHLAAFPLPERLQPWIETEVTRLRLGPVDILALPGEPFPELFLGGYDGKLRFSQPLVSPENPSPPDLQRAPKGPYGRELLDGRHGIIISMAGDAIGYLVPEYDFKAAPTRSMSPRPPGHHYEETNSLGRGAAAGLSAAVHDLLGSAAP